MKFHYTPQSPSFPSRTWVWKEGRGGRPVVLGMILKREHRDPEKAYVWHHYDDETLLSGFKGFASTRGQAAARLYDHFCKVKFGDMEGTLVLKEGF